MRLGLSADAATGATVKELVRACMQRGLTALELTLDGNADIADAVDWHDVTHGTDVRISGILTDAAGYAHELSALSRRLRAPIIVGGSGDVRRRLIFTRSIMEHGGNARALMSGPAAVWLDEVAMAGVGVAWQVDDSCADPPGDAELMSRRLGVVEYVRIAGSGPEAALREGRGVDQLMKYLTLAGYGGPLILTPSSRRYHLVWSAWLGRRGGWSCGSHAGRATGSVVQLTTSAGGLWRQSTETPQARAASFGRSCGGESERAHLLAPPAQPMSRGGPTTLMP